jgi:mannitol/fructose-specific phosphotransferase system IIA component
VDYRDLLKRYMRVILDREGVDFLDGQAMYVSAGIAFSDEEWAELLRLAADARVESDIGPLR